MQVSKMAWLIIGGVIVVGTGTLIIVSAQKKKRGGKYGNKGLDAKSKSKLDKVQKGIKSGDFKAITEPDWSNPFDMNYANDVSKWVFPKKVQELKPGVADELAEKLDEAKSSFMLINTSDIQSVKDVFKRLKDKVQVANLSRSFWENEKKDMWEHLASFMDHEQLEKYVHKQVRQLPNYRLV